MGRAFRTPCRTLVTDGPACYIDNIRIPAAEILFRERLPMDATQLDQLEQTFKTAGAAAAIDKLAAELKAKKDFAALFYTLLMKKRVELGVSPIATRSSADVPASAHRAFEDGIADAARTVGQLYLADGQIPQAWGYYRMLNEPAPVAAALEKLELDDSMDVQAIIDIAFHQGVAKQGLTGFAASARAASASSHVRRTADHARGQGRGAEKSDSHAAQQTGRLRANRTRAELQANRQDRASDRGAAIGCSTTISIISLSHLNSVLQMATQHNVASWK